MLINVDVRITKVWFLAFKQLTCEGAWWRSYDLSQIGLFLLSFVFVL